VENPELEIVQKSRACETRALRVILTLACNSVEVKTSLLWTDRGHGHDTPRDIYMSRLKWTVVKLLEESYPHV